MSTKRLRSVIQSTAHHAVSGLCYIHPHLGALCKEQDIKSIRVSLYEAKFEPALINITKELELSTDALREKFNEILDSEKITLNEIQNAYATFEFLQAKWPVGCCVSVRNLEGKVIEVAVGSDGKSAEVLRGYC
jgi:hypothetical protein